MNDEIEKVKAERAKNDLLRAAVLKWMDDEANALRLRANRDAPMWVEYQESCAELAAARRAAGV